MEPEVFQLPGAVGTHSPRPSVRQAVGHPQFVAGMAAVKSWLQLALGQARLHFWHNRPTRPPGPWHECQP